MAAITDKLLAIVAPKKKLKTGGSANTPTFNPQQTAQVLTYPNYRDHLEDIFATRQNSNSQELLRTLFEQDTDLSATVHGYLTLADTQMTAYMEDINGQVDPAASLELQQLITRLSFQTDYTQGFQLKQTLDKQTEEFRYMLLLRGALGCDLVYDKTQNPDSLRNVDMASIRWYEKQPGVYKPGQIVPGQSDPVMLDTPSFFVAFYRRSPLSVYTTSPFVSAINSIAARQQVINDLYRIMRVSGYPRIQIKVLEEILRKNIPAGLNAPGKEGDKQAWIDQRLDEIGTNFSNIAVDEAIVHMDSVEFSILNERSPGLTLQVQPIIDVLNAQNQAGLKSMSTLLGRGGAGVNTGSVEARIAALFSDQLNMPIADLYSRLFSFIFHQRGYQGFARVQFEPAELRPWTELEPQLVLRAQRLRQDLSDGLITDVEYHLQMYQRLPPAGAPELSGTQFMSVAEAAGAGGDSGSGASTGTRPEDVSPKSGSLNRAVSPARTSQTARNPAKRKLAASQDLVEQALQLIAERKTS